MLTARVQNGRLVLDVPTALPEGTELDLLPPDEEDQEREDLQELLRALALAESQLRSGQGVSAEQALARIFSKDG